MHYGPINSSSTILGNINKVTGTIFTQINNVLNPMIAAYNNLVSTGQAGVQGQITTTIAAINVLSSNLNSFVNNWSTLFIVNYI